MHSDGVIPQADPPEPGAYARAAAIADIKAAADAAHDLRGITAAIVRGDATPTRRSDAASVNELHTNIEAAEPYCESTGPMPTADDAAVRARYDGVVDALIARATSVQDSEAQRRAELESVADRLACGPLPYAEVELTIGRWRVDGERRRAEPDVGIDAGFEASTLRMPERWMRPILRAIARDLLARGRDADTVRSCLESVADAMTFEDLIPAAVLRDIEESVYVNYRDPRSACD